MVYDVLIIGGGISGLAFAYECEKSDMSCLLLESSDRLGGCVHSYSSRAGAAEIELGAHTLYNSYATCIELIEEFGLSTKAIPRKKILIKSKIEGRARSLFRNIRFFSAVSKFLESIVHHRGIPPLNSEPKLLLFLSKLFGTNNVISFFKPLLQALYNQSPDGLPSDVFVKTRQRSRNTAYPKKFTLVGGIESLTKALATRVRYKLASRVESIQTGELFSVHTSSETFRCSSLVFAVPASSLAHFPELVEQTGHNGTVRFETSVLCLQPDDLPSIVTFDSDIAYSEIIQQSEDIHKVCHHPSRLNLSGRLLLKEQRLPDLSNRTQCNATKPHIYLIGNHFSGLALENCVVYAREAFLDLKRARAERMSRLASNL